MWIRLSLSTSNVMARAQRAPLGQAMGLTMAPAASAPLLCSCVALHQRELLLARQRTAPEDFGKYHQRDHWHEDHCRDRGVCRRRIEGESGIDVSRQDRSGPAEIERNVEIAPRQKKR